MNKDCNYCQITITTKKIETIESEKQNLENAAECIGKSAVEKENQYTCIVDNVLIRKYTMFL